MFVEYIEKTMPEDARKKFERKVFSDEQLKREFHIFQYTQLIPDYSIVYPFKNKLKKKRNIWTVFPYAASVAILMSTIYFFQKYKYSTQPSPHNLEISAHKNISDNTATKTPSFSNTLTLQSYSNKISQYTHVQKNNIPNHKKTIPSSIKTIPDTDSITTIHSNKVHDSITITFQQVFPTKDTVHQLQKNIQTIEYSSEFITSAQQMEAEENTNIQHTSVFQSVFNFLKRKKISIQTQESFVIEYNQKNLITLHIPKIEIKNKDNVTFEEVRSSY